jgi:hypothetical protein
MLQFQEMNCDQDRRWEDFKKQRPDNRNTAHVEFNNKIGTSNNRGNWDHLKIFQKIPEQHTGKARNQGTTENGHTGHCTHTAESTGVKEQKGYHREYQYMHHEL